MLMSFRMMQETLYNIQKKKYDLIIYGLLDSHTSLSGKGGIRLDSYVYTVDAFEEAKKILTDDGYISLSFSVSIKSLGVKILSQQDWAKLLK